MAQRKKRKGKARKSQWQLSQITQDERVIKVVGLLFMFLGVYLTIALISYLFTWQGDQDKVLKYSWNLLFNGDVSVQNWSGRLGAILSNGFMYWGFGLPSLLFVFLLFKFGIVLIKRQSLKNYLKTFTQVLLFTCFLSIILEFVLHSSTFSWGGAMGSAAYLWMSTFIGKVGLGLLFIMVALLIMTWMINPTMEFSTDGFKQVFDDSTSSQISYFKSLSIFQSKEGTSKSKRRTKTSAVDSDFPEFEDTNDTSQKEASSTIIEPIDFGNDDVMEFDIEAAPKRPKKSNIPAPDLELEVEETHSQQLPNTTAQRTSASQISDEPLEVVDPNKVTGADGSEKVMPIQQENTDDLDPYDPKLDLSDYTHPTLDLLVEYEQDNVQIDRAELQANKEQIVNTLRNYKIEITKIRATIGPTVTLYEIVPAPGVKISKIKNLEDDIALNLAALGIRIIAPIPGKGTIGIEVPNKNKQTVSLKEVLASDKFQNGKMDLPIALGKTIANEVFVADLAKMPHLLIAGATGQGKSVGINTILMSLLYKKHPSQVKLVLIDPKKVELYPYTNLEKHFLGFLPDADEPIITDTTKVIHTLNSLTIEMDERYDLLKKARSRNIKEYNAKFTARKLNPQNGHRFLPFIVLVIDEFADLIMTAGKEVELPIARIAQLARAVGIHMIIATQRPTTNIITGMIKANFPARISFKVTSNVDSRTILDAKGAEQLIGRGDMLLTVGSDLIRLQCAFVDTPEVERVIDHIGDQRGYAVPYHLPEFKGEGDIGGEGSNLKWSDLDENFEDAARLIVAAQSGSTSLIQRKMSLGYNRAGRIMDQLESCNVVGPSNGSKPREVYFMTEMELLDHLERLKNA